MIDYPILIFWSDEDEAYIADVPDLGCFSAHGATPEEALGKNRIAPASLIQGAREQGLGLPSPTVRFGPEGVLIDRQERGRVFQRSR